VSAVARLDRAARARALTRELQDALEVAVGVVAELWRDELWRELGHATWAEYCAAEVPNLAVLVRGMPKQERRAKVAELRRDGMSLRGVAEATGLAPNTVRTDAAAEGVRLAKVIGLDGVERPAAAAPRTRAPRVPTTTRLLAVVAAAGPDGLTVREACQRARLPREVVAPALFRLSESGRLVYRRPARRGLFGTYVGRIEP
jgi:hypothetical protein